MKERSSGLLNSIEHSFARLSKGQKAIAAFILSNYESAAYATAARIGDEVGVSESTVVRFAMELGYDGYPHFQKALQEELKSRLTSVQRMKASARLSEKEDILGAVLQSDIEKLRQASGAIDRGLFEQAISTIMAADKIHILGVRSAAPLASFLAFYFNLIFDNVHLINTTSVSEVFEQIITVRESDVVIGISFPRYSRRTIKAMEYSRSTGATVIAITDKMGTAVAANADISLLVPSGMTSFVDSLVAPLSVINALIASIGYKRQDIVAEKLNKLEHIWEEYEVYDKGDDHNG
jgi:DNA-binding MurR/RpiR family transcriptional regulator